MFTVDMKSEIQVELTWSIRPEGIQLIIAKAPIDHHYKDAVFQKSGKTVNVDGNVSERSRSYSVPRITEISGLWLLDAAISLFKIHWLERVLEQLLQRTNSI